MAKFPVQTQNFQLYGGGPAAGDTTLTLTTFTDILGNPLTMANFGDKGYGTIEPNNGTNEDSIVFTGITQNTNGTATLTGVHSVGFLYPYTPSSGLRIAHAGATSFIITNTSYFYYDAFVSTADTEVISGNITFTGNNLFTGTNAYTNLNTFSGTTIVTQTPTTNTQVANKLYVDTSIATEDALVVHIAGTETITGKKTFVLNPISGTPVLGTELATKSYVDGVAVAGAPNANTTTKGIVQLSTATQTSAGTATGSTGAALVAPNSLFSSLSTGATTVVVSNGSGKIDLSYIPTDIKFGGTGADGALTITSGTTTIDCANALIVEKNYTSVSITGTGTLSFINPNTNGTTVILKSQGGVTLTSSSTPMIDLTLMGAAANTSAFSLIGRVPTAVSGGAGGCSISTSGGAGGATAGVSPLPTAPTSFYRSVLIGPGAGGGNGKNSNNGGAGGGALIVECGGAFNFTTTSGISVAGSTGANTAGGASNSGGGGAGSVLVLYNVLTANTGTVTVTGGAAGTGGSGLAGGAGGTGYSLVAKNNEFI
jgi:hypothetical protein